jgi:tetratricopeptide (TPR) repeat protein
MLMYYEYRRVLDGSLYASALQCYERVTVRDLDVADAWAGLALLLLDGYAYGYVEDVHEDALLAEAREAARLAMDIEGENVLANLALARVQFFSGADFVRTAEQAVALRPNNTEALSLVGSMLVLGGDLARGSEFVDRAIELSPKAPGNYYASQAMARLRARRYEDALASALRIDSPNWPTGDFIVMAAAALAGRADIAARARERLGEAAAGAAPATLFARWPVVDDLRAEFRRGLEIANSTR